jgi:hypothetical protein
MPLSLSSTVERAEYSRRIRNRVLEVRQRYRRTALSAQNSPRRRF